MLDIAIKEIIAASISIAKDIFGERLKEKNKQLLEKKKKEATEKGMSFAKRERVTLGSDELITGEVLISPDESYRYLRQHLDQVRDWSSRIGFRDLRGTKELSNVYVELDTWLSPLSSQFGEIERNHKEPLLSAAYSSPSHVVILGQPGAGKTTSMQKLCSDLIAMPHRHGLSFPILIRLRDVSEDSDGLSLHNRLAATVAIKYELRHFENNELSNLVYPPLLSLLDAISPLIILDGFDEIRSYDLKQSVLEEVRVICRTLKSAKVVLTCRSGDFNYHIERAQLFEISPLSTEQVKLFSRKWLGNDADCEAFLGAVTHSPFFDATIKPLSLAHLCVIYERIGQIPDRPKTVYRKIVRLLLDEWDEQRSVKRSSQYASFESDRKIDFLAHLAYYLSTRFNCAVFCREQFLEGYKNICQNFGLEVRQAESVVSELESHTGLFIKSGYDSFEFAHKSIQEFLSADYLVKLPSIPRYAEVLKVIPNELAIATAISSHPSSYFIELVVNYFGKMALPSEFFDTFVSRIIVEKPDFYLSVDELILAINMLMTLWVTSEKFTGRDIAIRDVNYHVFQQFIELKERIESNLDSEIVNSYFFMPTEHSAEIGSVTLYKIQRRMEHEMYELPQYMLVSRPIVRQYA